MLVLVQDKCMICAKHTVGTEIVLDTPDGTLSYEAQVEAQVQGLRRTYHRLRKHFERT
jgi:hypothetical protein